MKPDLKNLPLPVQLATAEQQEKWLWRINSKLIDAHNAAGSEAEKQAILRKQKNVLHQVNRLRDQSVDENGNPRPSLKAEGMAFADYDSYIDIDKINGVGR